MRYLGNKTKLLEFIENVIDKHKIQGDSFADLFAGTGSVGDFFKGRHQIISNDFMYYSFVINKAKLSFNEPPKFDRFSEKYSANIFNWLNSKIFKPNKHFFIYNNYSPIGDRMFFTKENALKIDGIRITIEELYKDKILSENEYYYLLASLLESVTKVSNTSGTYEAFFKFWESRAKKDFQIEPLDLFKCKTAKEHVVYSEETNKIVRQIEGDIAYLDPPYSVTQYASAYHVLETIARYDFPFIKGVGGKRDKGKNVSLYSRKQLAINQFEDLFRQIKFNHILLSYSNQSIVELEELVLLAKKFAVDNKVHIEELNYKEYKNHRSSKKGNGKKLKEVIIYFRKDLKHNKSPLNYSGSKDTLLNEIIKELPKKVDVFVDAMGGAFNVGANIVANKKVIYNENNPFIFNLIDWIINNDRKYLTNKIEENIKSFKLKKGSKDEYIKLRDYYNQKDPSSLNLYTLHMYGFQNMIRFNSSLKYNTPNGVAGYSDDIKNRMLSFIPKTKKVDLTNLCYSEIDYHSFEKDTLFYFDPPYFITSAAYNDGKRGMKGWNADSEIELLSILTKIDKLGLKFILSNVIAHKGKTNHILNEWIDEHNYKVVPIGKSGWRYSKNEVLIKNFND